MTILGLIILYSSTSIAKRYDSNSALEKLFENLKRSSVKYSTEDINSIFESYLSNPKLNKMSLKSSIW
jgi:hypothetical protein